MLFVVLVKVSLNFTKAGVTWEEGVPPSQQLVGVLVGRASPRWAVPPCASTQHSSLAPAPVPASTFLLQFPL